MHAHSSFARLTHMLAFTYLSFAAQNTCTHICKHKNTHTNIHTNTHARKSSNPAQPSVLKVRFVGKISPALSSAPSSIMLVFHKITKSRPLRAFLSSALPPILKLTHEPSKSPPTIRFKLHFMDFQ